MAYTLLQDWSLLGPKTFVGDNFINGSVKAEIHYISFPVASS